MAARMEAFGAAADLGAISADDIPDAGASTSRLEQQIAMLAVRLEMTAVYLKLVRG